MKEKNRILWIGSSQSETQFRNMSTDNIGQASSYASQKGLIKGIDKVLGDDTVLDSINLVCYPAYPVYQSINVPEEIWSRKNGSYDLQVGYKNKGLLRYFYREKEVYRGVRKWAADHAKNTDKIFIYGPTVGKLRGALYLKKKFNCDVYVIIPDIPDFVNLNASKVIRILKRVAGFIMRHSFRKADGFILYSALMADFYKFSPEQWMLMEGVFDEDEIALANDCAERENKTIFYCGSLDKDRGIVNLLEAFHSIEDKECRLVLAGRGDAEEDINKFSQLDGRIEYIGFITDRQRILELERKVGVLIHLWDTEKFSVTYGFPSKLFEYLVSGGTVIAPKMVEISEEYQKYILSIDNTSVDGIKDTLLKALSIDSNDRLKNGLAARNFIMEKKSSVAQARRILKFAKII